MDHQSGGAGPVDYLLESAQFKRLTEEFEKATGLTLHAYSLTAVPPGPLRYSLEPPERRRILELEGLRTSQPLASV